MSITETRLHEYEAVLTVRERRTVADGVVALTLALSDGSPLPGWTPGAHVDLVLTEQLTRQYSLCGKASDETSWRVAVLRDPAGTGGSAYVHDRLTEGSSVRVRGPRNHFPLVASPRYLFIAGGIGVTPILPMIESAVAAGADWRLVYGGRTRASMAFLDELEQLDAGGGRVGVVPQDVAGLLDLDALLGTPQPDTLVYCCGPEALLTAVETRCAPGVLGEYGGAWPAGALHVERFSAKPVADSPGGDTAFEVVLQRSGLTVPVPAGESVFDAVRAAGVSVLGSCLKGICGTCETGVISGEVDHRDSVLDAEEQEANDFMMICVSRCRGERLVLDL